jgi:hypothetical protein
VFCKSTYGVSQGPIPVPLLFIIYIKSFPPRINTLSEPVVFADETDVIISGENFYNLCLMSNIVVSHMHKWFTANNLTLNPGKTSVIKFIMNNSLPYVLSIGYNDKIYSIVCKLIITSIGRVILIKCFISYVYHVMHVGYCFTSATLTLKIIYFACFYSVMRFE